MSPTSYQTAPSRNNIYTAYTKIIWFIILVRKGGLEPPRPKALPPQGSVSTNSTTTAACVGHSMRFINKLKEKNSIILLFLVQLVKFQANSIEQVQLWSALFSNHMHLKSVSWRKQPNLNW